MYNERRHRHRFAVIDFPHFCLPKEFATRGIDGAHVVVERVKENLSLVEKTTAIHHIATSDALGRG